MPAVNSRASLINYAMQALGAPVLEINVDNDQVEDRVDDTLQIYGEYHVDGTVRSYLAYQLTSADMTNGYISLDPSVIYVTRMFPFSGNSMSSGMFGWKYQMMSEIVGGMSGNGGLAYYDATQQYMETLDMQMRGVPQVQFQRRQNRLYIFGDITDGDVVAGDFIVAEVFKTVDPRTASGIYNDRFVKGYLTALIKKQWGMNMSKFEGMQLPGGITISGRQMIEDANVEIKELYDNLRLEFEQPVDFFVG